jgi:hypothetical protein
VRALPGPVAWWLYALFLTLGVHAVATVIYGAMHDRVGPVRPMELFHQWWLFYIFVFGLFQGPLAEELGWRGFLLPRFLNKYSPLLASVIAGLVWAAWHSEVFFSPLPALALSTAGAVALSILMTVLCPEKISQVSHSQPPRSHRIGRACAGTVRAVVVITVAVCVVAITGKRLTLQAPSRMNA